MRAIFASSGISPIERTHMMARSRSVPGAGVSMDATIEERGRSGSFRRCSGRACPAARHPRLSSNG